MASELKPEIKDGMSQSERHLASLDAGYFGIDEKDTPDLLNLLVDLSGQFNYYNFANKIEGDWKAFLTSDTDILIALLSRLDSRSMTEEYRKRSNDIVYAESEKQLLAHLNALFRFIQDFIRVLAGYHTGFEMAGNQQQLHHFTPGTASLTPHIKTLETYRQSAVELQGKIAVDRQTQAFTYDSNPAIATPPFNGSGSIREKVIQGLPYLDKLFTEINAQYAGLLRKSQHYLKNQTLNGNVYDPHVALLIAFLHLYKHLQKPINGLMQKHLDYFYQDIIGMKPRLEVPDHVHLVLEPAPAAAPFYITRGEQLVAEIPGFQDNLLYALAHDVQLSGARIAELKTVFVSNKHLAKERNNDTTEVNERQVYKGNYPVPSAATFLKEKDTFAPWPLLGEEQSELPYHQKTMAATDIGLLVASPLFYQADGRRDFYLRFSIQEKALEQFDKHVNNLASALKRSKEVLLPEILHEAFTLAITGGTGWLAIPAYTVSYQEGLGLDIWFNIPAEQEPVAVYNHDLHGHNFTNVTWPILRLLLNNASFHHPYSFLSYLIIDRIAIRVEVKESKNFKLKNNLGDLYSGSPFQPFGPVPAVGSYLDIKNTNIFNRYTTDFCLRLCWYNLPREAGGFGEYYTGYNYPFTNEAFKIQLNSTADARAVTQSDEQQLFPLFQTSTPSGRPKTCTLLTGIDFKRIKFDNVPALDRENEDAEPYFKQGTVRLELIAPHEGFGHRLYPQVFTQTILHNARRLTKNHPIPNQPYVPVIKSLSIDYTLEHSEQTNGASTESESEVQLIHLYPFGFNTFYTGKNAEQNFFIPPPDQNSNLLIGISNLVSGQELSLLFQLSEKNFHHTVHEPDEISWSHLVNNRWLPITKAGVLQDTTGNFVKSGIITLKIPGDIASGNTILNPDLYWIRASLPGESTVRSKVLGIFAQAALATRLPEQFLFPEYSYTLPPASVKGFKGKQPKIKGVSQLSASFNGQPQESYNHYNTRVSERLRHKNRLLSTQDICQAVLDAFPQILMVKCYTSGQESAMVLPGVDVHLIVIPKEREDGSFISQQPKVNLSVLYEIKRFISRAVSEFVQVEVGNPIYEKVMVVARVKFKNTGPAQLSNGYYLKLLNQDIKKYISEWLYDPACDFQIGSQLYVSELLNYLQNRDYIAYITGFSLIHFYKSWNKIDNTFQAQVTDTSVNKVDSLKGSVSGAILIPAEEHLLTVIDNAVPEEPKKSGIGEFTIGSGLLVHHATPAKAGSPAPTVPLPAELYDFTVFNE